MDNIVGSSQGAVTRRCVCSDECHHGRLLASLVLLRVMVATSSHDDVWLFLASLLRVML